ncbi:MAG TPA: ABC transporter substrate binding protein [bacterium]|nr:ABC transporter substrate binding protein [bacterium]HPR87965.1 ABC transporter substrate binding protein [bacterium]
MELWVGALNLGFLYAIMTMGVFVTFRIHDFNDVTVDGSFTAGAAAAAVLMTLGINPLLALLAAFAIGALAGWVTAFIHTRFAINGLLAGILVMTALYSINLHIMGRSNLPLLNQRTLFSWLAAVNPGLHPEVWTAAVFAVVMLLFWLLMTFFFRTDLGIAMRVTGNNPVMAAANGINVGRMTRFGVALANGFTGASGALVAQYQGFADIGMGLGTVVIGMAAVIIGESLIRSRSMLLRVLSVILGAVVFRGMIALALYAGMNPIDLKLLTAVFVLLTLVLSRSMGGGKKPAGVERRWLQLLRQPGRRRALYAGLVIVAALAAAVFMRHAATSAAKSASGKKVQIGVVQLTENGLLNTTRDALVRELGRRGYRDGENCRIKLESAAGELPTVSTILDQFEREKMDVIVTISTGCTQVALNKIKSRPVVFATVANPFLIKAGRSDTEHLPNVTGVYGWVPMDRTLALVRQIRPGPLTIGTIWDPAQPNSVFNVENLQRAAEAAPGVTFAGATITSSAEVYQAAVALAQKGIDAFVLSPDNIVYSAFEAVVKAAGPRRIPIFLSDVERLGDGALAVLGYEYSSSGEQAAALVDRIIKGEKPADIPFETYHKLTLGVNLDVAGANGITLGDTLLRQANLIVRGGRSIAVAGEAGAAAAAKVIHNARLMSPVEAGAAATRSGGGTR